MSVRAAVLTSIVVSLAAAGTADAAVVARGSAEQVQVTGAQAGARVTLVDRAGRVRGRERAGKLGGAVFRGVKPGGGYRVRVPGAKVSKRLRVLTTAPTPPSLAGYDQELPSKGYGYLTTRDGTKLAMTVRLPSGDGPYPTLVEYSGYGYADPSGGESSIAAIANLMGFAVVDVNMRGTGCSGGAFDYFERLQALDGYDVVETVARQPWVAGGKVGMMGISYGGISQLFVASTQPPSLAAIAPLSVIDDTATTLYPGGVLNTGFALSWAKDRVDDAKAATAKAGQRWAFDRIKAGDKTCRANQALHPEAVDLLAKVEANDRYVPRVADPLAPRTLVNRIKVPTFLACQWTDEQTGGHCPTLASRFTGTDKAWFTFTNGTHIDSLDPATFVRWYDFLQLYVANRAPAAAPDVRGVAPTVYQAVMGVPDVQLPEDPIRAVPTYEAALAAFEALPRVRVLFDNGAGSAVPGAPVPGFEQSFDRFPLPGTRAASWYLGAGGTLTDAAPAAAGSDAFTWDPKARPATDFSGNTSAGPGGLWTATPPYAWTAAPAGNAAAYETAPLAATTAVVGAGALEAWVRSSAPSVDLQATLSEIRPDGQETFVQSGWLRTRLRTLDAKRSTELAPVLSLRKADEARMPKGKFAKLTVPLYYQGHAYRAGSRIRVTIAAVGGDQPVWAFGATKPAKGTARVTISHAPGRPSRLVLPVVPGVAVPTPLPPCPSLRGQPCRAAAPIANTAG